MQILVGNVSVSSTVIIIKAKKKTTDSRTCGERKKTPTRSQVEIKNTYWPHQKPPLTTFLMAVASSQSVAPLCFFFALVLMAHHAPAGPQPLIHFSPSVQCNDTPSPPPSTMDPHLSAEADGIYWRLKSMRFQLPVLAAPRQSSFTTVCLRSLSFQWLGRLFRVFLCFLQRFAACDAEVGDQRLFIIVAKSCRDLTEWSVSQLRVCILRRIRPPSAEGVHKAFCDTGICDVQSRCTLQIG